MRGGWVERGSVAIRLGRPHFAFYRGYLDGLDLGSLANRYLAPSLTGSDGAALADGGNARVDLRVARSMVRWIRAQLQVAARRSLGPADARLLGVAPAALLAPAPVGVPSLEQFQEEFDPDGLFSEAELIAEFSHAYPGTTARPARHAARNQRLRMRQHHALARLEQLTAADPRPADPVDAWLDAALATRLANAGVGSLQDLLNLIDRHGYRWYRKVPRIGLKAALHIAAWFNQDGVREALGRGLPAHALQATRSKHRREAGSPAAIVPMSPGVSDVIAADGSCAGGSLLAELGRLRNDPARSGVSGSNRGLHCRLKADDDQAAIEAWLSARDPAPHTLRAYRREIERFQLWTAGECGKPISGMTTEDCDRYRVFLAMLGRSHPDAWAGSFRLPQETWIGPRGVLRTSGYWRPFHGPLGVASQRQSLVIIQSLLQWLHAQDYLHTCPMQHAGRRLSHGGAGSDNRGLTRFEWSIARAGSATARQADPASGLREAAVTKEAACVAEAVPFLDMVETVVDDMGGQTSAVNHVDRDPQRCAALRVQLILSLACGAGLRLSEISNLRRRHLLSHQRVNDGVSCWLLQVSGKAGSMREVSLSPAVMDDLCAYVHGRGQDLVSMSLSTPLVTALLPRPGPRAGAEAAVSDAALSAQRIYALVKRFFANAAKRIETADPERAELLRAASPRSLRHAFAERALEHGIDLDVLRDLLGYRSLATPSHRTQAERDRRSLAVEALAKATAF